jgi:integrase
MSGPGPGSVFSYTTKSGRRKWGFVLDLPPVPDGQGRLKRQQLRRQGLARELDLSQYLDQWLRIGRKANGEPWRPSTAATYGTSVRCYLKPGLGHLCLIDLRREHVEKLAAAMRDGTIRPGRYNAPLSDRTIHQARATLRVALNQAIIDHKITVNPCKGARVPGPGRGEVQFWSPEQLAVFLAHAAQREPRFAVAFQFAGWRGLRRGELCGLKWDDLDLDGGEAHIRRNVTEADRQVHVGSPKTERGERTVSIGPKLVAALRAHRKAQAVRSLEGWVFPGPDGRVLAPHCLTHRFKALVRELPELPELHLHELRHTAATLMLLQGIPVKIVSDQLGHSKVELTLNLYAQVLPQQRDASADAVEALFSEAL